MKYVGTISAELWNEDGLKHVFRNVDGHELYAGREVGKTGYHHYQFCIDCGGDLEEYNNKNSCGWHIEPCVDWESAINYCRKTGNYLYIGDSIEEMEWNKLLKLVRRRGYARPWINIINSLLHQNDRQITVWIDRKGSQGKSTLSYILQRRGCAIAIPRLDLAGSRMAEFITINYKNQRVIILDLPRAQYLEPEHCNVLEDVKDGCLATGKYQGFQKFIRGAKVLVFTNQYITKETYNSLSKDRWDIWKITEEHPEGIKHIGGNHQGNT